LHREQDGGEAQGEAQGEAPVRKAGIGQVAATMFWALFMIGKKSTWERDGARITFAQAVVGALVAGAVVVLILAALVYFALH
jgi:riboflavin transporter FmnP